LFRDDVKGRIELWDLVGNRSPDQREDDSRRMKQRGSGVDEDAMAAIRYKF
jgi:hypothetical protein